MHELIESPDDVIAVKLSQSIDGNDLEAIMDRVDDIMSRNEKIHVFVETQAIQGLQLSALPHHMSRAMPMFGKLGRFGRVAVVADQAWMRLATRMESAVLPFVSYRVFEPDKRDEALAWVIGKQSE
jgi:stage II sporulation SpoAA-like protein